MSKKKTLDDVKAERERVDRSAHHYTKHVFSVTEQNHALSILLSEFEPTRPK